MLTLWMAFGMALASAIVLTPLARSFALWLGIVDRPDGGRKLQKRAVPLFGGVAVYLALVLGVLVATFFADEQQPELLELSRVLIAATGFVCLFGCVDDTWDLSPRFKLLLQTCSVLPIVLEGYSIERLYAFGQPFELGWLGVPITVLWLVACINALNLLDGMDGLASLVGLSTAAMLAIIALNLGHSHVSLIAIALAGALVGFLLYNLPPASIYLGDSGSMVIGMVIGLLGMQAALKTPATLSITAPAVLMSIPMLDTLLAIVRRKLSGQRFDSADRGHIHHRLLERGLNNWQALGVIGLLCVLTGSAAAAAIFLRSDGVAWAIALSLVVFLVRLRVFGHHELALVKLTIATALVRLVQRMINSLRPRACHAHAAENPDFAAAWTELIEEVRPWSTISLELSSGWGALAARRHTWRLAGWLPDAALEWSFVVSFRGQRDHCCELRLGGQGHQAIEPWQQTRVVQVLTAFCQHWSEHAEQIPASQHWSDASDGGIVGLPATLSVHPAAKAA
jgi:UDP-GlcNAc:undecaprenyl-phosphate GlcNAc-1-phosphate transferase